MTVLEKTMPVQDALQGAYSHGLESIYKVETIDLKTVRRLQAIELPPETSSKHFHKIDVQLEFDFGAKYRSWVQPYLDREPIQVLQCTKPLEKWLLENGFHTIRALRFADLSTEPFLRKLGQAHREEVASKLRSYLKDKPLTQTKQFDSLSLLKALCFHLDRKKLAVALKPFGLEGLLTLSPMELAELKKVTPIEEGEWRREIKTSIDQSFLDESYQRIADAWLSPWIEKRGGIATSDELMEYLELISLDPFSTAKFFAFLPFPFREFLPSEGDLFFASEETKKEAFKFEELLLSYFPSKGFRYAMDQLIAFAIKESLLKGEYPSKKMMQSILHRSPCFDVNQQFVDIAQISQ
jgi:hypothetical protein